MSRLLSESEWPLPSLAQNLRRQGSVNPPLTEFGIPQVPTLAGIGGRLLELSGLVIELH